MQFVTPVRPSWPPISDPSSPPWGLAQKLLQGQGGSSNICPTIPTLYGMVPGCKPEPLQRPSAHLAETIEK